MRMRGFQDLPSGYNNPVRGDEHKDFHQVNFSRFLVPRKREKRTIFPLIFSIFLLFFLFFWGLAAYFPWIPC